MGAHTLPYAELTAAKVSPWVSVSFSFPQLGKVKGEQVQEIDDLVPCLVQVCAHPGGAERGV